MHSPSIDGLRIESPQLRCHGYRVSRWVIAVDLEVKPFVHHDKVVALVENARQVVWLAWGPSIPLRLLAGCKAQHGSRGLKWKGRFKGSEQYSQHRSGEVLNEPNLSWRPIMLHVLRQYTIIEPLSEPR